MKPAPLYLLEQEAGLTDQGIRRTKRAQSAAERGANLTRRLLAFSRRQPLAPSAVEIDVFIRDLADLIEYSVGQGVAVELELAAQGVCAWVDRGQLENALLNLAINARDAMPSGGTLCLRSRHEVERDEVIIEVSDDGQGMDPVIRDRVFEPFFTTKSDSGSGLRPEHRLWIHPPVRRRNRTEKRPRQRHDLHSASAHACP